MRLVDGKGPAIRSNSRARGLVPAFHGCVKWTLLWTGLLLLTQAVSFGRLGDTRQQAEDRYGPPDKVLAAGKSSLLEGAREWMFEYRGWQITCAMVLATDGREYVVRERYQKIWNTKVMKEGGSPSIRDYEVAVILEAEGGAAKWTKRTIHDGKGGMPKNLEDLIRGAFGPGWVRADGAVAHKLGTQFTLELPQAQMREAELKRIRERKQRQNASGLLGGNPARSGPPVRASSQLTSLMPHTQPDRARLEELIASVAGDPGEALLNVPLWAPVFLRSIDLTAPACPKCGEAIANRKGPRGSFWGCQSFPRCRGKRDMRKYVTPLMIAAEPVRV